MEPLEPWQTAWPALALGLTVVGAGAASLRGAALRPSSGALLIAGVALLVRLVVLPALGRHEYDGHEAEYWDIFRGARPLSRGGTVLYPAMQWLWAGLGAVLPAHPAVPVLLMVLVGVAGVLLYAGALSRRVGPAAGLGLGLALAVHPVHAAWSSSAYNVALPWTLLALSFAAVERAQRPGFGGAAPWALAAASAGLALLCRLDAAAGLLLPLGLLVEGELRAGRGPAHLLRRAAHGLVIVLPIAVLVGFGVWPLVVPGGVPGEGERLLSLQSNLLWGAPYAELRSWPGALALAGAALLGARRSAGLALAAALAALLGHMLLATFDDFADRHALFLSPALLVAGAAGLEGRGRAAPRLGRAAWAAVLVSALLGLYELRGRYYGSEEALAAALSRVEPWAGLPQWTGPGAAPAGCAWVSEAGRFSAWSGREAPALSQFNLLDPAEAAALRGEGGCMLLVLDLQDWRWSSRGVRDRSLRMQHLYALRPIAVVSEAGAGYPWGVAVEVGPRRCCTPLGLDLDPGRSTLGAGPDRGGWAPATRVLP